MKSHQRKSKGLWRYALPLLTISVFGFVASDVLATHTVEETEDIRNTKHYLVANPDVKAQSTNVSVPMTEICVFCHTPHGANPNAAGLAPIWNRNLQSTTYTPYSAPNFDAAGSTPGKPKGVSLACLSCHDGTIAVDALINAPGSGGFEIGNRGSGAGVSVPGITFTALGIIDANSTMNEGFRDGTEQNTTSLSPYSGGIHDTLTNTDLLEGAQPFPNLGVDLTDDHPIGMALPQSCCNAESPGIEDPQFSELNDGSSTFDGGVNGINVLFISRDGSIAFDKRDRLRLYPSSSTQLQTVPDAYYVECASCHNPHTPRVSFLRLPNPKGLGVINPGTLIPSAWSLEDSNFSLTWAKKPNAGSAICLSCHQK